MHKLKEYQIDGLLCVLQTEIPRTPTSCPKFSNKIQIYMFGRKPVVSLLSQYTTCSISLGNAEFLLVSESSSTQG